MESREYKIRIKEILDTEWGDWFEGMEIRRGPDETTILAGCFADQAALYGVLIRLRNLNLTLLDVSSGPCHEDPERIKSQ